MRKIFTQPKITDGIIFNTSSTVVSFYNQNVVVLWASNSYKITKKCKQIFQ